VAEAELDRAKAQVKASVLMSLESTGSRASKLARQLQVFGRVLSTAETVRKIMGVTVADIQRAAIRHSVPDRRWRPWGRPRGCRTSPRLPVP